jgi:hypothetical protein
MKIIQETGSHFDLNEGSARNLMNELLSRPLFAHLATNSEQGPCESPVWYLWEEEAIWIIGNCETDTFPKRIKLNPRCAIGIVDFDIFTGLVQHIGFRGSASIESHDEERMKRLISRYLGSVELWDPRFIEILNDLNYIFIRFEPETAVVRDQSYKVVSNSGK